MRIIIVPGSRARVPSALAWPARALYRSLGVDPSAEDDQWPLQLKVFLERRGERDVQVFSWSGGVTRTRSLEPAAAELARMLDERDTETVLFCKSLGGIVGEIAAGSCHALVRRLICVATPHGPRAPPLAPGTELVDVTSPADSYLALGNLILHRQRRKPIAGARHVPIPGLSHSEFNKDIPLIFDGEEMTLYGAYARLIGAAGSGNYMNAPARKSAHAPRRRPRASRP